MQLGSPAPQLCVTLGRHHCPQRERRACMGLHKLRLPMRDALMRGWL